MNHSYSSLKLFEQCPKQFKEVRILKRWPKVDTDATRFGTEFHLAAEEYVRDGKPLPPKFAVYQKYLTPLVAMGGTKMCEYEMGLTQEFEPCAFDAPDVFIRGIADLVIINEATGVARVVDYKTSKSSRFADTAQLSLMAAMVFKHFPAINTVKAGLLFVIADDWVPREYKRSELPSLLQAPVATINRIDKAVEVDVWNAKQSPLCKFCPVDKATCVHKRD